MRKSAHAFGYSGINRDGVLDIEPDEARIHRRGGNELDDGVGRWGQWTYHRAGAATILRWMIVGLLRVFIGGNLSRAVVRIVPVSGVRIGMMTMLFGACVRGHLRETQRHAAR
jgi:hypothetical protein